MIDISRSMARRFNRKINPFKAQKGQDKWVIFTILPLKTRGFFLDLAAADGVTYSNTYVLEKLFGWKGICIEPNPKFLRKLKKFRSCIIDNSVISDKVEEVSFRIDNGQNGGIVAKDTDNNYLVRGEQFENAEIISLNTVMLTNLLDYYNAPKTIDYFSLDVEGSEERIIRSLNFKKYKFRCLTIERPTPKVNEILLKNDYVFVKNFRFDSFYIHRSVTYHRRIHCQPFEQILPKNW